MDDMSYPALKEYIYSALNVSSTDLSALAKAFSQLYTSFQTDAVKQVRVETIPNTCFKWVYSTESDRAKVLLFFHGGGYTMGNTEDHLELIAQLVLQTKATVMSVDYRLVPDYFFPTPVLDVKSAYLWLLQHGHDPNSIAFSGISAGGLLVTQLIYACQQDKIPMPKVALVMSGPSNLSFEGASFQYNASRDWISTERLRNIQQYYLPKNLNPNDLLISPVDADYENYPITLFQAGDYEILLSDSIRFYEHLRQMNHPVYLNVVPGLPHCWQFFAKVYPPGRYAIHQAAEFLNHFW